MASEHAQRIMTLFEGYDQAWGTYDKTDENPSKGGKLEIKATARTERGPVTVDLWEEHLAGRRSLGIIPIRENDTCLWGVIDVDQYGTSHAEVVERIAKHDLPLVVCRSKSGGAHLFMFLSEPVAASALQSKLKEMAALLGYGSSEIFPKQAKVLLERGDLGNWLNMPYFGGDKTDRYAVKPGGAVMTVGEFLSTAYDMRQPASYLQKSHRKVPNKPDLGDGPPCLQHMAAAGFPEGTRNKGLFALGVFAKRKYGTRWKEQIENFNRDYMSPPLNFEEVGEIIRSLEKKEYQYTCNDHPLATHCNSILCRTREFGVGGDGDYPVISDLAVLDIDPPLWFLSIEGVRLELNTDELQNYKLFHKACMERMYVCYRMMKQDTWLSMVAQAMKNATRISVPQEIGTRGQLMELISEFVNDRHRAKERDELLLGRPWQDPDTKRHYFQMKDLMHHLEVAKFNKLNRAQITTRIEQLGGGKKFFNLKGRGINVWWIPALEETPEVGLPPVEGSPI